uniref:Uncharacterized protein n=1 Tax=Octopus bimaculoides TaxID=37653 RepID=A0A0L8GR33_OCTBM
MKQQNDKKKNIQMRNSHIGDTEYPHTHNLGLCQNNKSKYLLLGLNDRLQLRTF